MNPSNKNPIDYSKFGGTRIQDEIQATPQINQLESQPINNENVAKSNIDYSKFGGTPIKETKAQEKVGKAKSLLYGLAEGVLGIPGLIQYGVNEWSKGLEKAFGSESPDLPFEKENPILAFTSSFPESEDEASRRIRTGAAGAITGAPFGLPGIIAGLVGSQAGQTIREVYGKEGKFDEFGLGEGAALLADAVAGGAAGVGTSLAQGAGRAAASEAARIPAIFQEGKTALQRAVARNTIQGEKNALQNVVNSFSNSQVRGFEQEASRLSPVKFTELTQSGAAGLKQNADKMFRNAQLNTISPIAATPEQGSRAIQEAANTLFQQNVIGAEREAYNSARKAAEGISGEAPRTIQQAKALRADLLKNNPTPEQQPVINFLNGLIGDLETTTPASTRPASTLLDASGNPLIPATEIAASSTPKPRGANDLVDLVQRSNQAVNYESELRQQSHRLAPIIATLRQEVGNVLSKNPQAVQLYQAANQLHAKNADIWGTKYMRNLRFSETPEKIIGQTKLASNMKNLKEAINDPTIQGLAERLVVNQIVDTGSPNANRIAINNLSPELSQNARNAAQELVNVKDPLTVSGGRAAIRNEILKDAAQSVNTGKRPDRILELMQTPKGYEIVKESLKDSPQSRELFKSFERLFVEDIFSSITDKTGMIDFTKARNILKNKDVQQVVENIGGKELVKRFNELEGFANNFEKNLNLYKSPETQTLFKSLFKNVKEAGLVGGILHALHVPLPVIAGLGLGKALLAGGKVTYKSLQSKILSNPRAIRILESISTANSTEQLSKQLPRFLSEIQDEIESE